MAESKKCYRCKHTLALELFKVMPSRRIASQCKGCCEKVKVYKLNKKNLLKAKVETNTMPESTLEDTKVEIKDTKVETNTMPESTLEDTKVEIKDTKVETNTMSLLEQKMIDTLKQALVETKMINTLEFILSDIKMTDALKQALVTKKDTKIELKTVLVNTIDEPKDTKVEPKSELKDTKVEPKSELKDTKVEPKSELKDTKVEPKSELKDTKVEPKSLIVLSLNEPKVAVTKSKKAVTKSKKAVTKPKKAAVTKPRAKKESIETECDDWIERPMSKADRKKQEKKNEKMEYKMLRAGIIKPKIERDMPKGELIDFLSIKDTLAQVENRSLITNQKLLKHVEAFKRKYCGYITSPFNKTTDDLDIDIASYNNYISFLILGTNLTWDNYGTEWELQFVDDVIYNNYRRVNWHWANTRPVLSAYKDCSVLKGKLKYTIARNGVEYNIHIVE